MLTRSHFSTSSSSHILKRVRTDPSAESSPATSASVLGGIYYIVNDFTETHAALLDNTDGLEIVSFTLGLRDDPDQGAKVSARQWLDSRRLTLF